MTPVIGHYGGYRKTLSFGLTCLVYHATTTFCRRNYNYKNDSLGKTVGQMVGAARSARQNIVEGSSRAGTSKENELKLLDVAKASLQELAGDYEAFIVDAGETPWSERDPKYVKAKALVFDDFEAKDDLRHEYGKHILAMRKRFAAALENEDPIVAANAVDLRLPLKPALPAELQLITPPRASAIETCVLLNVLRMNAMPAGIDFPLRFFATASPSAAAAPSAAGTAGAASGAASFFTSSLMSWIP